MNFAVKVNSIFQLSLGVVFLVSIFFLLASSGDDYAYAKNPALTVGEAGMIHSTVLKEDLKMFIYLPENYEQSQKRYPVLFHFYDEGLINLFHYSTGVTRFLSSNQIIPEMIVVSVQVNGVRDLTPTKAANYGPSSGGADTYIRFLKEEFIPYIDTTYRTTSQRIVWGHSIVGTFCIYCLLKEPSLFSDYITSSPFFIYDGYEGFLMKNTKKFLEGRRNQENALYITVGDELHLGPVIEAFINILNTNKPKGLKWEYKVNKKENHNTNQSLCLEEGLRYLYSH